MDEGRLWSARFEANNAERGCERLNLLQIEYKGLYCRHPRSKAFSYLPHTHAHIIKLNVESQTSWLHFLFTQITTSWPPCVWSHQLNWWLWFSFPPHYIITHCLYLLPQSYSMWSDYLTSTTSDVVWNNQLNICFVIEDNNGGNLTRPLASFSCVHFILKDWKRQTDLQGGVWYCWSYKTSNWDWTFNWLIKKFI